MLTSITSFFEKCLKPAHNDTSATTTDKLHLACAALLMELSVADHERGEEEIQAMRKILRDTFHLEDKQLDELWELAHQEARSATSLYQFTSLINSGYGYEEKMRLLKHMWEVAYADGRVDRYEDHMIRKVAELLYLSHNDFIRMKLASRPVESGQAQ
ncbi:MAG: TerB family tellurite resistance protein [Pseudomonadota bacterium]